MCRLQLRTHLLPRPSPRHLRRRPCSLTALVLPACPASQTWPQPSLRWLSRSRRTGMSMGPPRHGASGRGRGGGRSSSCRSRRFACACRRRHSHSSSSHSSSSSSSSSNSTSSTNLRRRLHSSRRRSSSSHRRSRGCSSALLPEVTATAALGVPSAQQPSLPWILCIRRSRGCSSALLPAATATAAWACQARSSHHCPGFCVFVQGRASQPGTARCSGGAGHGCGLSGACGAAPRPAHAPQAPWAPGSAMAAATAAAVAAASPLLAQTHPAAAAAAGQHCWRRACRRGTPLPHRLNARYNRAPEGWHAQTRPAHCQS